MSRTLRLFLLAIAVAPGIFTKEDPVQWTLKPANGASSIAPGGKAYLELKASIEPGWHLYSPTTAPGGPIKTTIRIADSPSIASYVVYRPQPVRKFDPNFQIETETYSDQATFFIEAIASAAASGKSTIRANVRYQSCTDVKCLPPVKKTAATDITFAPGVPETASVSGRSLR